MKVVHCMRPLTRFVRWRSLSTLSLHPKSDVSDFGHLILPNSGTPEFGGERVKKSPSGDALRARVMPYNASNDSAEHHRDEEFFGSHAEYDTIDAETV